MGKYKKKSDLAKENKSDIVVINWQKKSIKNVISFRRWGIIVVFIAGLKGRSNHLNLIARKFYFFYEKKGNIKNDEESVYTTHIFFLHLNHKYYEKLFFLSSLPHFHFSFNNIIIIIKNININIMVFNVLPQRLFWCVFICLEIIFHSYVFVGLFIIIIPYIIEYSLLFFLCIGEGKYFAPKFTRKHGWMGSFCCLKCLLLKMKKLSLDHSLLLLLFLTKRTDWLFGAFFDLFYKSNFVYLFRDNSLFRKQ